MGVSLVRVGDLERAGAYWRSTDRYLGGADINPGTTYTLHAPTARPPINFLISGAGVRAAAAKEEPGRRSGSENGEEREGREEGTRGPGRSGPFRGRASS